MTTDIIDVILRVASYGFMFFMALGNLAMSPVADLILDGFGTISSPFGLDITWTYDLDVLGVIGNLVEWFGSAVQHVLGNTFVNDYTLLEALLFLSALILGLVALGRFIGFIVDLLGIGG